MKNKNQNHNHKKISLSQSSDQVLDCQDKLAFDSQKQANAAKIVADLQHGASLKSYKCQKCGLWHLTSNY